MNLLPRSIEYSHWYTPSGVAVHEVPRADGQGMRPTTVADARKKGLLPSVTNVIGILEKPALTAWKCEQAILSALTLPRLPDEPDQDFAHRVVTDSDETRDKAAGFGRDFHSACSDYLQGKPPSVPISHLTHFEVWKEWADANVEKVWMTEQIVVGRGYAGTTDLVADLKGIGRSVVDFKTRTPQKLKSGFKLAPYFDSDCVQLCAYDMAIPGGFKALVSCLISSGTDCTLNIHRWPIDDHHRAHRLFVNLLDVWCLIKKYDPRTIIDINATLV